MGTLTKLVTTVGLVVAVGAMLLLGRSSGLAAGAPNFQLLGGAIAAFLFGIFLFGWGLGRRTRTRY